MMMNLRPKHGPEYQPGDSTNKSDLGNHLKFGPLSWVDRLNVMR